MILTNYWLLLIWLAVGGGLMAVGTRRTPMYVLGKTEYRWSRLAAFVLVLPYIVWAGNRRYFGDTSVYRATFLALPTIGIDAVNYLSAVTKDRGFTVLSIILKTFIGGNDTLFFLIIAAFQMFCIVHFCRRYSDDFFLCIFMFVVSTDYLSFMFNGMRQFIAVGMTLLSFCLLLRRKYVPAVLVRFEIPAYKVIRFLGQLVRFGYAIRLAFCISYYAHVLHDPINGTQARNLFLWMLNLQCQPDAFSAICVVVAILVQYFYDVVRNSLIFPRLILVTKIVIKALAAYVQTSAVKCYFPCNFAI